MALLSDNFPEAIRTFFSDIESSDATVQNVEKRFLEKIRKEEGSDSNFAWILSKSGLPWLALDIEAPWKDMLDEARRMKSRMAEHRTDPANKLSYRGSGWKALCLHGISPNQTESSNTYGYKREEDAPYRWTEISDLCPVTSKFFRTQFPFPSYHRLRFALLEPGGYILPHTDRPNSALWEINLALNHPQGCYFRMEGQGYVPQKTGSAFILDVSNVHSVINNSNEDRFHIIVHGNPFREPRFADLITRSYSKFVDRIERSGEITQATK